MINYYYKIKLNNWKTNFFNKLKSKLKNSSSNLLKKLKIFTITIIIEAIKNKIKKIIIC